MAEVRNRCNIRLQPALILWCVASVALLMMPRLSSLADQSGSGLDGNPAWTSKSGYYRVSYTSKLNPIVINRIHSWVLHVETADSKPVVDAEITVDGGMPAHDHGLPTSPRTTQYLGDGNYVIEGLRFHMNGYWEIVITINARGRRDTVVIPLDL